MDISNIGDVLKEASESVANASAIGCTKITTTVHSINFQEAVQRRYILKGPYQLCHRYFLAGEMPIEKRFVSLS